MFVLGLAITFTVLGMIAALAGKMYGDVSGAWNWIVAAVCVVMGLHLMGVLTVPIPSLGGKLQPKTRGIPRRVRAGAALRRRVGAVRRAHPRRAAHLPRRLGLVGRRGAALLLLVYALGHSVLILIAGTSMGAARKLIENKKATRVLELLRRGAGAAIVLVGVYFAYSGIK